MSNLTIELINKVAAGEDGAVKSYIIPRTSVMHTGDLGNYNNIASNISENSIFSTKDKRTPESVLGKTTARGYTYNNPLTGTISLMSHDNPSDAFSDAVARHAEITRFENKRLPQGVTDSLNHPFRNSWVPDPFQEQFNMNSPERITLRDFPNMTDEEKKEFVENKGKPVKTTPDVINKVDTTTPKETQVTGVGATAAPLGKNELDIIEDRVRSVYAANGHIDPMVTHNVVREHILGGDRLLNNMTELQQKLNAAHIAHQEGKAKATAAAAAQEAKEVKPTTVMSDADKITGKMGLGKKLGIGGALLGAGALGSYYLWNRNHQR